MRLWGWVLFITVLQFGCAAKTVNSEQRAGYHLQIGSGHLAKGNYPAALGEFLKAEELDPDNPLIHNQLGLAYFLRQRLDLAEKHFRQAIKLNAKFTEARNNLGRTLIERGQFKAAIVELNIAAKDLLYVEPDKIYSNLGLAYFQMADYSQAEKKFLESLKLRRKNCFVQSYYGRSLYELSAFDKAAEVLDQAIETCKSMNFEDPYYFSALSYMKTGQREQAVARLEEGLATFPQGQFAAKARSMLEILK